MHVMKPTGYEDSCMPALTAVLQVDRMLECELESVLELLQLQGCKFLPLKKFKVVSLIPCLQQLISAPGCNAHAG